MSDERVDQPELAAGVSLGDLTCAELERLESLAGDASFAAEVDAFDRSAGSLVYAMAEADSMSASQSMPAMPAGVADRVRSMGRAWAATQQPSGAEAPATLAFPAAARSRPYGAMLALAAAVAILVVAALVTTGRSGVTPTPTAVQLIAAGANHAEWIIGPDPLGGGESVRGQVVWDAVSQRGVMTFEGLAANDPLEFVYQLWIFDEARPTDQLPQFGDGLLSSRPVDGGVFNIAASNQDGIVEVPIDAKLPVGQARVFAITIEPPGGVVVSDRKRIPVLAQLP